MKLLIVRHADAGDQAEFAKTGEPDSLRPLSQKGRDQIQAALDGLKKLVPSVDLIVTSPYTRAVQTAEIVHAAYGEEIPLEATATLEPEVPPAEFGTWLRTQGEREVVAAVGHEPHLSTLATWLMTGTDESRVELKKGGACLLYFDKRVHKGGGVLEWLMGPKQLKAFG
ncbi:MAG: histidine phosphatase family protein [Gemmatimonadaceae bacterium]